MQWNPFANNDDDEDWPDVEPEVLEEVMDIVDGVQQMTDAADQGPLPGTK